MFTIPLEQIFTKSNLKEAFLEISSNAKGLDEVSYHNYKNNLSKNLEELIYEIKTGSYSPEPIKKISIEKPNSNQRRPIGLSSLKDKIVQRVLYLSLNPYFDKQFSSNSYAYRKGKSTIKAIRRTANYIQQNHHFVLKTDIDDFFESINHDKLLKILEKHLSDKRIIRVISLFLQTGGFKKFDYFEHSLGVHQGDILSPLLSNIYLDILDRFLQKRDIAFVRYADDFILLFKKENQAQKFKPKLEKFLKVLDLHLGEDKTYIHHINEGFTFLGVYFAGKNIKVDNDRLQKAISHIHEISKKNNKFSTYIEKLNIYLETLKNYYLKIIKPNSTQHNLLKEHIIEALAYKMYLCKSNKSIKTKKEFRNFAQSIKLDILFQEEQIKDKIELSISIAYEKYLANKSYKDTKAKIDKKKNIYAKKFSLDSTLHIATPGRSLGIAKNKFTIKEYGKVQKAVPIDRVKRIIIEAKGVSLSSNIIHRCSKEGITIDFIGKNYLPFAALVTYKASTTQLIHKQAMILGTKKQLALAKQFIKAKSKNQINYIKYLNKYHNNLEKNITKMLNIQTNINLAKNNEELLGYEGSISAIYWDSLRLILKVPFEKRVTYQARDIVNSSLNYAYAILYGKVQHSLVQAGLSLNISFLHSLDEQKPTLSFDLIEEFRTFIVDRTIVSMFNKDENIALGKDGLLNKASRQLIAKNIKEKLGSYTMYKKQSQKCENIIQDQAYKLVNAVKQKDYKYKSFIGKF